MNSNNESHKRNRELSHIGDELRRIGGVVQEELKELGLAVPDREEGDTPAWNGMSVDFDMSSCEEDSGITDVCDAALDELIFEVMGNGANEAQASNTVYDILGDLIDKGAVAEMPEMSDSEGDKAGWIANTIPRIKTELQKRRVLPDGGTVLAKVDR